MWKVKHPRVRSLRAELGWIPGCRRRPTWPVEVIGPGGGVRPLRSGNSPRPLVTEMAGLQNAPDRAVEQFRVILPGQEPDSSSGRTCPGRALKINWAWARRARARPRSGTGTGWLGLTAGRGVSRAPAVSSCRRRAGQRRWAAGQSADALLRALLDGGYGTRPLCCLSITLDQAPGSGHALTYCFRRRRSEAGSGRPARGTSTAPREAWRRAPRCGRVVKVRRRTAQGAPPPDEHLRERGRGALPLTLGDSSYADFGTRWTAAPRQRGTDLRPSSALGSPHPYGSSWTTFVRPRLLVDDVVPPTGVRARAEA